MARFSIRPRASLKGYQGHVGALCVVGAVAALTAWPWGLLALGGFLLLGSATSA